MDQNVMVRATMADLELKLCEYRDAIVKSYADYQNLTAPANLNQSANRVRMFNEFSDGVRVVYGKKYARVFTKDSIHSFIVITHNDPKFKFGDILLPAGIATPAKNKARGNLFDKYYIVCWTGPQYLR